MGEYRSSCHQDVPRHDCKYYVLYTPIAGPYWWNTKEIADREKKEADLRASNSFIPVAVPPRPLSVYRYGSAARLKGIVTDLPAFELIGVLKGQKVSVQLTKFATEDAWYRQVILHMAEKNAFFINPYAHFSPISNLPLASKTTVIFARVSGLIMEDTFSGDPGTFVEDVHSDEDGPDGWEEVSGEDDDEEASSEDMFEDAPPRPADTASVVPFAAPPATIKIPFGPPPATTGSVTQHPLSTVVHSAVAASPAIKSVAQQQQPQPSSVVKTSKKKKSSHKKRVVEQEEEEEGEDYASSEDADSKVVDLNGLSSNSWS